MFVLGKRFKGILYITIYNMTSNDINDYLTAIITNFNVMTSHKNYDDDFHFAKICNMLLEHLNQDVNERIRIYIIERIEKLKINIENNMYSDILNNIDKTELIELLDKLKISPFTFKFVPKKIGSSSLIPIELHNFYSMRFDITFDNFHYVYFYAGTYNDAPVGQNTDSYVFSEIINSNKQNILKNLFDMNEIRNNCKRWIDDYTCIYDAI